MKVRGFRIELGEIEAALEHHDGVKQAVVVTRTRSRRRRPPGGLLVPPGGGGTAELRKALRRTLPDYMLPSVFVSQPSCR